MKFRIAWKLDQETKMCYVRDDENYVKTKFKILQNMLNRFGYLTINDVFKEFYQKPIPEGFLPGWIMGDTIKYHVDIYDVDYYEITIWPEKEDLRRCIYIL